MNFWDRNRRDDCDVDLDQWIKNALDAEIAEREATFDFRAGLADVYARAGLVQPATISSPPQPSGQAGDDADLAAVQDVADHIQMLDTLLAAVTKADNTPLLLGSYLGMARQFLLQLRTGLTARRLSQREAFGLIQDVRHDIREADKVLRRQQGLSLEQVMHTRIGELQEINTDMADQMELLEQKVMRLFDQSDEPAALIPVPY
ncbi:hypothetical protein OHR68_07015 [Spirillospora sp. NBC_00431]